MPRTDYTANRAAPLGDIWATLAEPQTAEALGPAELGRALVQFVNLLLVKKYEADLATIDDQRKRVDTLATELRQQLSAATTPIVLWLRERAAAACILNEDPPKVVGCTLVLGDAIKARFGATLAQLDLRAANEAWSAYQDISRTQRLRQFSDNVVMGGWVAGVGFVLLLLANAFTDGVGFFKTVYFLGVVGGLAVAFFNASERTQHRTSIEAAFATAQRKIAETLSAAEAAAKRLEKQIDTERSNTHSGLHKQEQALCQAYASELQKIETAFRQLRKAAGLHGQNMDNPNWANWEPASTAPKFLRIGQMLAPTAALDKRLKPPAPLTPLPALLPFGPGAGVCLLGSTDTKAKRVVAAQGIALRLVAAIPPGKLRFTFIDPIGLGQNAAPLLALGDHVEEIIGGRAWSEPAHIEQRLAELTQHMETVIQKYLRNEHKTIEAYNKAAGRVVEAYRVVVVCDFPANFTEASARRLAAIAQNGPRCGVYPVVVVDSDRPMPYGVSLEALTAHLTCVRDDREGSVWLDPDSQTWTVQHDASAPDAVIQRLTKSHGELAEAGMRVSVPFTDLVTSAGLDKSTWRDQAIASSADSLVVPLGQSGARKYQEAVFGKGTSHHALVVGQTGSGKSNLLHALITMLALKYAPDELELYLVDFKQGVEFKLYAEAALPHARVIAIQSEREFGLSVLRGLLAEMDRRGDLFRSEGVPGLADWRKRTGKKLPRVLLVIDEFRVFFTADDTIATEATMIIDRLVSQGRGFGIHVVLASQTLAGSYALPRSITDQMAVRIVLQCTEADSRLALADDNPEARLLSRPGEAIYNDQRGLIEGNHRFQAADMGDDEGRAAIVRRYLAPRIASWHGAVQRPIVFEGHRPATLEAAGPVAVAVNGSQWSVPARFVDVWLGEPIALRPPTAIRFLRQGAANLLMVMRDEQQAVTLIETVIIALAAQLPPTVAGFHIVDMTSVDAPWAGALEQLSSALPHRANVVRRRGLEQALDTVGQELERRLKSERPAAETIFMVFTGLHRMQDLREDEGAAWSAGGETPNARNTFAKLLREGPEVGIHSVLWVDSYSSAARVLDRRMLGDCGRRILGAMSEQDSLALIDDPAAGHLNKPHRLVRFDEERPGEIETFRPYAVTDQSWFLDAARRLSQRSSSQAAT